ncbi:hypothetical protein [Streptomyces sp. NPDC053079]|uniref:hypothetical protein n=1 Tax=Streptomyces sp. NPDC053079 TaxID=3365697 RepID=UPI0037D48F2B
MPRRAPRSSPWSPSSPTPPSRAPAGAWDLSTGEDINYPGAIGPRPPLPARLLRGYVARMMRAGLVDASVMQALMGVMTLSAPVNALVSPGVLIAVARSSGRPVPPGPTLTAEERARVGLTPG